MRFPTVTAKIDNMRKPQRFIVMPMSNGNIMVQSDKRYGEFDSLSGHGFLSTKGNSSIHLHPSLGGKRFSFPPEFVAQCLSVLPDAGGSTDLGGVTVTHMVQVVE